MRILDASYEILDLGWTNYDAPKMAEYGGRQCYQSTHKITDGSWRKFVENIVKRGHTSVLEHGGVYLELPMPTRLRPYSDDIRAIMDSPYSFVDLDVHCDHETYLVYTNLRVILEKSPEMFNAIINKDDLPSPLSFFTPEANDPNRRLTVEFVVDRGITHEDVRHRVFSFSQESTRFCCYIREQFGSEISVIDIAPFMPADNDDNLDYEAYNVWLEAMESAERAYNRLIKLGYTAQIARSVLPNSLKADIIMTGSLAQWRDFFKLRTPPDAHPQMREVVVPLYNEMKDLYPCVAVA